VRSRREASEILRARFSLAWRLLVSAALIAIVGAAAPEVVFAEKTTQAEVAQALTCQCGCGLTVANCNMPTCGFSVPVRGEIDGMIGKGMGRAQIIAFYRHKFGEKVLSAPTTEGFNLLAWTMPFIALAVGAGLIALAFGRWRTGAPIPGRESVASPLSFDPELRRRLESDLKEST
jgi:cytochrome c-type biogenesis protein CcmH